VADPIRVLLVDDHAVVREGLRAFLRLQRDMEVVGEAAGGDDALAVARSTQPDVIVLDLVMPGGDGISVLRRVREEVPQARVLVLTSFDDDAQIFAATSAGAGGYMLKDVDPSDLADVISAVAEGRPALDGRVAARLMRRAGAPPSDELTARERDVLTLMAEGLANKEIAQRLGIGEKTVKTHVSRVLDKLGVADRTQAAVLAIRRHLVG